MCESSGAKENMFDFIVSQGSLTTSRFTLAKRNYLARRLEIHTSSSPFLSDGADDY